MKPDGAAQDGPSLATLLGLVEPHRAAHQGPDDVALARQQLFRAAADVLSNAATTMPMLLIVEDVHWADRNSIELLQSLIRTIRHRRLMIVVTGRGDEMLEGHPIHPLFSELVRHPDTTRVMLDGLDTDTVRSLIDATWPELVAPDALAGPLRDSTEGNPLFIGEVLHDLRGADLGAEIATLDAMAVPRGIREITNRRLGELPEAAVQVIVTAAVLGLEFTAAALAQVGEFGDRGALLDALDAGERAGILANSVSPSTLRFRHRYFRDVAYQSLSSTRRAYIHLRVANMLTAHGAPTRVIAHHLLEAGDSGDLDHALAVVTQAAQDCVSQLDAADAVRLLRRALTVFGLRPLAARARTEILLALARVLTQSGRYLDGKGAAASAWQLALERGDETAMVEAALEHGRFGVGVGIDVTSVHLLERTLDTVAEPHLRRAGDGSTGVSHRCFWLK